MQVALVGLGVMGKNLALNLIEKGLTLVAYDKNPDAGAELLSCAKALGLADRLHIVSDLNDMVRRLEPPRSILLLVPAGELVDKLTINYNRSRQAAITKELIEIISGAESL